MSKQQQKKLERDMRGVEPVRPQPRRTPGAVGGASRLRATGQRRLCLDLDPAVYQALRVRAAESGLSMAAFIRREVAKLAGVQR